MCDLNLKPRFLHRFDEFAKDHNKIRLFKQLVDKLNLAHSRAIDFHCLT